MIKLPLSRIEKAAAAETLPAINGVHYDHDKRRLVATNGHIMAVVPVDSEGEERSFLIPLPVVAAARRSRSKERPLEGGRVTGTAEGVVCEVKDLGPVTVPVYHGEFPDVDEASLDAELARPRQVKVALDVDLLARLAEALCTECAGRRGRPVYLEIAEPSQPILVRPLNGAGLGLIMPVQCGYGNEEEEGGGGKSRWWRR